MTNTAKALHSFFSGFGLPAYAEYSVPDEAQLPYITYQLTESDWRDQSSLYARIWYRSARLTEVNAKADQIRAAVGECASIPTDTGALYLYPGSPYAQYMPMEGDDTLKVVYLNFTLTAHTR